VALAVLLEGQHTDDVAGVLRRYGAFRRERTDVVQAEARKNGHRYNSKYESLAVRDQEVANSAALRKGFYDYDVESAAIALRKRDRVTA
jgi:salicylate hydroxylase